MAPASRSKALLMTGVASVALVASLFVLVPRDAGATMVLLQSSGVAQPAGDYSFDVVATVTIPAGQLAPLSFAEVLVNDEGGSFNPGTGRLSGNVCAATTPAGVLILSIGPGSSTFGNFTGTRHNVTSGSGFGLNATGYSVDYGYGYGYGSSSKATTLVVRLRVLGCLDAGDFPGGPQQDFAIQVFLGADAAKSFPSVPVQVILFKPDFDAPESNTGAVGSSLIEGTATSSGGFAGVPYIFSDTDGDLTPFEPILSGTTLNHTFPDIGPGAGVSFAVTTKQDVPAGTQLLFTFHGEAAGNQPPFGINGAVLDGVTKGKAPPFFFQVLLSIPGQGFVPASPYIEMTITLRVGDDYFAASLTNPGRFNIAAFAADGTLELIQPRLVPPIVRDGDERLFTYRIQAFSSFAGYGRAGGDGTIVDTSVPVEPTTSAPTSAAATSSASGSPTTAPTSAPTTGPTSRATTPAITTGPGNNQNNDPGNGQGRDTGTSAGPGDSGDGRSADLRPESGFPWSTLWLVVAGVAVAALLVGGLLLMRRK